MSERFSRHLNLGEPIEIDGDKYYLKSLGTEYASDLFKVQKFMLPLYKETKGKEVKDDEFIDLFSKFPDELIVLATRLVKKTLEISYPEDAKDGDMDRFAAKYLWQLFMGVMKVNSASSKKDDLPPTLIANATKRD